MGSLGIYIVLKTYYLHSLRTMFNKKHVEKDVWTSMINFKNYFNYNTLCSKNLKYKIIFAALIVKTTRRNFAL